jgi:hypothetical protein
MILTCLAAGRAACINECKRIEAISISSGATNCRAYETKTCTDWTAESPPAVTAPSDGGAYALCVAMTGVPRTDFFICNGNCVDPCPTDTFSEMTPPANYANGTICGAANDDTVIKECTGSGGGGSGGG